MGQFDGGTKEESGLFLTFLQTNSVDSDGSLVLSTSDFRGSALIPGGALCFCPTVVPNRCVCGCDLGIAWSKCRNCRHIQSCKKCNFCFSLNFSEIHCFHFLDSANLWPFGLALCHCRSALHVLLAPGGYAGRCLLRALRLQRVSWFFEFYLNCFVLRVLSICLWFPRVHRVHMSTAPLRWPGAAGCLAVSASRILAHGRCKSGTFTTVACQMINLMSILVRLVQQVQLTIGANAAKTAKVSCRWSTFWWICGMFSAIRICLGDPFLWPDGRMVRRGCKLTAFSFSACTLFCFSWQWWNPQRHCLRWTVSLLLTTFSHSGRPLFAWRFCGVFVKLWQGEQCRHLQTSDSMTAQLQGM